MAKAQFDKDSILDKTIMLFWQQGYHGTSMQDVTATTGLKPGSLYNSFGNKEQLFIASLERYAQRSADKMKLAMSHGTGEGIVMLLTDMVAARGKKDYTQKDYASCFIIKTQLELTRTEPKLAKLAGDYLSRTKAQYKVAIASEYGEALSEVYATSVMMAIFGIRVYGYQQPNEADVLESLRLSLHWLPWTKH
ncbi:TetR family transcriptional regulator [Alteromonas sp. 76-1]|uniref:TetR/AcrR family transcriptional regulator n=1 Tax=Alteromonas sp. 76-1 TaxID=2358187 RepID=UPI000FD164B7|nr:TetR/AcrR family transcriptional regulator [Alteromonas sp. 76-1]VEL96649.1 TetR family transcriptional regulator [Alteromonas sp. 76-1]